MAEGGALPFYDRLINQIKIIFPDFDENRIRETVQPILDSMEPMDEEQILNRCLDAILSKDAESPDHRTETPSKRQGSEREGATASKRLRPTEPDSSLDNDGPEWILFDDDNDNSGGAVESNSSSKEPAMKITDPEEARRGNVDFITAMFPWICQEWLAVQVGKANFNTEVLINYIIENMKTIPKKEKMKAKSNIASSTAPKSAANASSGPDSNIPSSSGTSSRSKADSSSTASVRNYLNNYEVYDGSVAPKVMANYLGHRFPWLYLVGIQSVLRRFNNRYAPSFNAIYQTTKDLKDIDYKNLRGKFVVVKIEKTDKAQEFVSVPVLTGRRHSRFTIPSAIREEVAWVDRHFKLGDGTSEGPPLVAMGDDGGEELTDEQREMNLNMARENGETFECTICYGEYIIARDMVACSDGHSFCVECLQRHAKEAIFGQAKVDLLCMNEDCEARFMSAMLSKALDPATIKQLEEKRMTQALNMADLEGLERCKDCNYGMIFDVPPNVNKVFYCPECGNEYCRICKVDWEEHVGRPCKEVETEDDTRMRREAEERMAAAVIRFCNRCKQSLIKSDGCNKITCPCGTLMCYLCRQTVPGYEHFCNHLLEPGHPCSQCKRCLLWENPEVKDQAALNSIQSEVKKHLEETGKELKVGGDLPEPKNIPPMIAHGQPRQPLNGPARLAVPLPPPPQLMPMGGRFLIPPPPLIHHGPVRAAVPQAAPIFIHPIAGEVQRQFQQDAARLQRELMEQQERRDRMVRRFHEMEADGRRQQQMERHRQEQEARLQRAREHQAAAALRQHSPPRHRDRDQSPRRQGPGYHAQNLDSPRRRDRDRSPQRRPNGARLQSVIGAVIQHEKK